MGRSHSEDNIQTEGLLRRFRRKMGIVLSTSTAKWPKMLIAAYILATLGFIYGVTSHVTNFSSSRPLATEIRRLRLQNTGESSLGQNDGPLSPVRTLRISRGSNRFGDPRLDAYTIVVNTFKRDSCLERVIEHWRQCSRALEVRISWSDVERDPPKWILNDAIQTPAGYVVDIHEENKLTNRFHPLSNGDESDRFQTDAIFSIDDDLLFDCALVDEAFEIWRRNGGTRMVGFAPRMLKTDGYVWNSPYRGAEEKNTLFITKGAFVHRDAYSAFFKPESVELRDTVDAHITAEDMLMSIVFANMYEQAPIHVRVAHAQAQKLCCRAGEVVRLDTRGESRKETGHNCLLSRPWYERWRLWELGLGFRSSFSRGPILEKALKHFGTRTLKYVTSESFETSSTAESLGHWKDDHDGYPLPWEWI